MQLFIMQHPVTQEYLTSAKTLLMSTADTWGDLDLVPDDEYEYILNRLADDRYWTKDINEATTFRASDREVYEYFINGRVLEVQLGMI